MKEQLISFETAKLAKEKGFDPLPQGIYTKYYSKTDEYELLVFKRSVTSVRNDDIKVVTQSLLQKWLRDKHDILVESTHYTAKYFTFKIYERNSRINIIKLGSVDNLYDTYEEALENGLQEALKLIK